MSDSDNNTSDSDLDDEVEVFKEDIKIFASTLSNIKAKSKPIPRKEAKIHRDLGFITPEKFDFVDDMDSEFQSQLLKVTLHNLIKSKADLYEGDLVDFLDDDSSLGVYIIVDGKLEKLLTHNGHFMPHRKFIFPLYPIKYWDIQLYSSRYWIDIKSVEIIISNNQIKIENKNIAFSEYLLNENKDIINNALSILLKRSDAKSLLFENKHFTHDDNLIYLIGFPDKFKATSLWDELYLQATNLIYSKTLIEYSDSFIAQLSNSNIKCVKAQKRLSFASNILTDFIYSPLIEITREYM